MKTFVAACSLILASGGTFAQEWYYGDFSVRNPDLGGLQYPSTMSDPVPSSAPVAISLDELQRGNPDGYSGMTEGYGYVPPGFVPSGPTITSRDVFMQGNPDLGYDVDLSLPVVGSADARR